MKTKEERIIWLNNNSKFKLIEDDKIQKLSNNKSISSNKKILEYYRYADEILEKLSSLQKINETINYTSPCPFLKNNSCSIYSVRPMFCRTAMSFEPGFTSCGSTKEHFYNNTKIGFAKEALAGKLGDHFEIRQVFEILKSFDLV